MPNQPDSTMASVHKFRVAATLADPFGATRTASSTSSEVWVTQRPTRQLRRLAIERPDPASG